jgi:hypothetical protein
MLAQSPEDANQVLVEHGRGAVRLLRKEDNLTNIEAILLTPVPAYRYLGGAFRGDAEHAVGQGLKIHHANGAADRMESGIREGVAPGLLKQDDDKVLALFETPAEHIDIATFKKLQRQAPARKHH